MCSERVCAAARVRMVGCEGGARQLRGWHKIRKVYACAVVCARSVCAVVRATHLVARIAIVTVTFAIANICPTAKLLEIVLEDSVKLEGGCELSERTSAVHVVRLAMYFLDR